jgi:Domain of unknown function (DUF4268)
VSMTAPQLRLEFWRTFKLYMSNASTIGCSRATSDGWMWHSADLSSGYLASLVNARRGDIGVRFRLNGMNADTVYSFLRSRKEEIDAALGVALAWRSGDRGSHVIEAMHAADISEHAAWPEHMAWLRDRLEGFRETLWPLVGRVPPPHRRRVWNEELFFHELSEWNSTGLIPAKELLRDARRRGDGVHWGRGGQSGSFAPTISRHGVAYQLVSVRTDGTLQFLLSRLKESPIFENRSRRLELLARVNEVQCVHFPDQSIDRRPAMPLGLLTDSSAAAEFAKLMDWFRDAVQASLFAP